MTQEPRPVISFDIEATNRCNAECVMCPRDKLKRPPGEMERDVFHRLVAEIADVEELWALRDIWFTGLGECLLHPELPEFVSHIKEVLKTRVGISTNGLLLTDGKIESLAAAGLDDIAVSVHGLKSHYNLIMEKHEFEVVLERVRRLVRLAGDRLHVWIVAVETNLNREHVRSAEFVKFWEAQGVYRTEIPRCHTRGGSLLDGRILNVPEKIPEDCEIFLPIQFIAWNGDLLACCSDMDGSTRIGNIKETSLKYMIEKKFDIKNPRGRFYTCKACPDAYSLENK